MTKTLNWHQPALFLLVLAGFLVYAVAALLMRKTAKVSLGFCEHHLSRRRIAVILNWSLSMAGLLALATAIVQQTGGLAIAGAVLLVAGATAGTMVARYVRIKKIDDQYIWLKGVNEAYLAQLPQVLLT